MIPESTNVYGLFHAPHGLRSILRAIDHTGNWAYIKQSGFNGTETLHLRSEFAEFDSDSLGDGVQHVLNGGVGGALEEVVAFVRVLSEALSRSGIEHFFEIYADRKLVHCIPE